MFDDLYREAYNKLKHEILSAAGGLLIEAPKEKNAYYSGQLHTMNEVIDIMNKIDEDLYAALSCEAEKEADYYESQLSADESRSKQL